MPSFKSLTPSFTTPDLPACVAFYRDVLGFTSTGEHRQGGRVVWTELRHGGVTLMFLASAGARIGRHDAAGAILYFQVEDVDGLRESLERNGAVVSPIEVTFYGMRECYVKDPDGRQLTLAEPSNADEPATARDL